MRRRKINVSGFAVMKEPCKTCPFVTNTLGNDATQPYLESLVTLQAQHTCHTVGDTMICRGGRDIMLRVLAAMRLIDSPTDEAFEARSKEMLGDRYLEPGTRPRRRKK